MQNPDLTGKALETLLIEAFRGGQEPSAWFLNPRDPGIVTLLRTVNAEEASTPPGPGRSSIAAHAAHVAYHLELISRVLQGDQQAFATADWSAAWEQQTVDDQQWEQLLRRLETLSNTWISASPHVDVRNEVMLTGSLASAAHFAYHLGAIRQILLTVRQSGNHS